MGQAFMLVNLDKKQYVHPHKMDDGYKLGEIAFSSGGTASALCLLIASNPDRFDNPSNVIGSWAGDRIALVGEYDSGDLEKFAESNSDKKDLWEVIRTEYKDISDKVKPILVY